MNDLIPKLWNSLIYIASKLKRSVGERREEVKKRRKYEKNVIKGGIEVDVKRSFG